MPTGAVNFREEPSTEAEFYKQFDEIAAGTAIYELRGHQSPDDEEGWVIGNVVTTDKCVTSLYGDTKMFFNTNYTKKLYVSILQLFKSSFALQNFY